MSALCKSDEDAGNGENGSLGTKVCAADRMAGSAGLVSVLSSLLSAGRGSIAWLLRGRAAGRSLR